jgi:hypothetical protein
MVSSTGADPTCRNKCRGRVSNHSCFICLDILIIGIRQPSHRCAENSLYRDDSGGRGWRDAHCWALDHLAGQNENQKTTLGQLRTAHEQLDLTQQGQITDRFTKAIDQLGMTDDKDPPDNKVEEVRLGGIYALEQIAEDAPDKYHWPIMQVFAAYVRKYASWQGTPFQEAKPAADIQAILKAIGRRTRYYKAYSFAQGNCLHWLTSEFLQWRVGVRIAATLLAPTSISGHS